LAWRFLFNYSLFFLRVSSLVSIFDKDIYSFQKPPFFTNKNQFILTMEINIADFLSTVCVFFYRFLAA